jgi:hypothetical protein
MESLIKKKFVNMSKENHGVPRNAEPFKSDAC